MKTRAEKKAWAKDKWRRILYQSLAVVRERRAARRLGLLRCKVHRVFDQLWQRSGPRLFCRSGAYDQLAAIMGTAREYTHIGNFNEAQCLEALRRLAERWPWLEIP